MGGKELEWADDYFILGVDRVGTSRPLITLSCTAAMINTLVNIPEQFGQSVKCKSEIVVTFGLYY